MRIGGGFFMEEREVWLKTPWQDGTTHVLFEPLDLIAARLAALVPRPRVNLTRFHGVFPPNSHWRAEITPAGRGKRRAGAKPLPAAKKHRVTQGTFSNATRSHLAMTWARRLKRVFRIDIEVCEQCGGAVRLVACIEDPDVITRILDHLNSKRRQLTRKNRGRRLPGCFPRS